MLVDGAARVLFANAAARRLLGSGGGLILRAGYLRGTGNSDMVQGLIATCSRKARAPHGPGGEMWIEARPAPFTPACDGDASAVKGHHCGASLARSRYSRGHGDRRQFGQGKMDELSGRATVAGQWMQFARRQPRSFCNGR